MPSCLSDHELELFCAGSLEEDVAARFMEHLDLCRDCAARCAAHDSPREKLLQQIRGLDGLPSAFHVPVAAGSTHSRSGQAVFVKSGSGPVIGAQIGPYRLESALGEGGFGVVFLADQEHPVRRKVALKLLKTGMESAQIIARFEAERQALALMDHPGVAKVFDAGTTDQGQSYFVMEFVAGTPITTYAGTRRLTLRQRLELFSLICEVVQHAHQKGIIHRDIKPSNVLVVEHDGRPSPKVIDFGIAKAIGQKLTDQTIQTLAGHFLGTPEYMSPEQADESGRGCDTRTDVYSLGVILYELLAGALPFESQRLRSAGCVEMIRVIREEDPPRPSVRRRVLSEADAPGGSDDGAGFGVLADALAGDLDWITMKALEKEPARRYQSAAELAADIGRYLNNEVVLASPPGRTYRMRKFVRRHRTAVVAAVGIAATLLGGVVTSTVFAFRADHERGIAQENADTARREARKAQSMNQFLEDLFAQANRAEQKGNPDVTVRAAMDRAADQLAAGTAEYEPEVEAAIRRMIGDIYYELGFYDQAEAQLRAALSLQRQCFARAHRDTALSLHGLARTMHAKGDADSAKTAYREAIQMWRALGLSDRREHAASLSMLGRLHLELGELPSAQENYQSAIALLRTLYPSGHRELASCLVGLGLALKTGGDLGRAEGLYQEALDMQRRVLGEEHVECAATLCNLAALESQRGDYTNAESHYEQGIAICRKLLGDAHQTTITALTGFASTQRQQGKTAHAEAIYREVLSQYRHSDYEDHPFIVGPLNGLALCLLERGEYAEAESLFREALEIFRTKLPGRAIAMSNTLYGLGRTCTALGQYQEAETLLLEAAEVLKAASSTYFKNRQRVLEALVALYRRWETAEPNVGHGARGEKWQNDLNGILSSFESTTTATAR